DCATGRCSAEGTCACGIDTANDLVRTWNAFNGGANRIRILTADGKTVLLPASFPQAVTPTMLAFRMPWDCFAPVCLEIAKKVQGHYVGTTIPLCDAGCPTTTTTTTSSSTSTSTRPSSTSTSSVPTTTSTSTSTTTTTLPCDRNPCGALDCDVA